MGHLRVLNHIYEGIGFTAVVLLVLFWLGYHGREWLLRRYGGSWRITGPAGLGALVLTPFRWFSVGAVVSVGPD